MLAAPLTGMREDATLIANEFLTNSAAQWLAILPGFRHEGHEIISSVNQVALPAAPHHRVAQPIEKAVAGVAFFGKIRAATVVQAGESAAIAAIGKVEQQATVAAVQIDRFDDVQYRFELY